MVQLVDLNYKFYCKNITGIARCLPNKMVRVTLVLQINPPEEQSDHPQILKLFRPGAVFKSKPYHGYYQKALLHLNVAEGLPR